MTTRLFRHKGFFPFNAGPISFRLMFSLSISAMVQMLTAQNWQPMGPEGGQVRCGVSIGNTLLVGTGSGVYQSTDGGNTFRPHSVGMPSGNIFDLIFHGKYVFACVENKGIYRSADSGVSWKLKLPGRFLQQSSVSYIRLQQADGHLMVRNSDDLKDTLYFSADFGDSWIRQPINVFHYLSNQVFGFGVAYFTNSAAGVLGPQQGLYRTDDLGQSWVYSGTGITSGVAVNAMVAMNDTLYALNKHIFRSTDQGRNWTQVTTDTLKNPNSSFAFSPAFYAVSGRTVYARNGGNANVVYTTWSPGQSRWQTPVTGSPITGAGLSMFAHAGKVFQSGFNGEWNAVSSPEQPFAPSTVKGLHANLLNHLSVVGNQAFSTTATQVLSAHDWNSGWAAINPGNIADNRPLWAITKVGGNLLVGVSDQFNGPLRLFYSSDQGLSWQSSTQTSLQARAQFLNFGDSAILYGTTGSGQEAGWVDRQGNAVRGLSGGSGFSGTNEWMSIRYNKDTLYGLLTRRNNPASNILKRHIKASNWTMVRQFLFPGGSFSMEIWQDNFYIGRALGGVWVSKDRGANWKDISTGLGSAVVQHLEAFGDTLAAASDKGVFLLRKGDTTWHNISGNLPVSGFIRVQATPNQLWVLAENGGVWRLPRGSFAQSANTPELLAPFRVFPNPAGDYLSFASGAGTWFMYDLQGRQLATGRTATDAELTTLRLDNLQTGQYLLKVQCQGKSQTARFIKQ